MGLRNANGVGAILKARQNSAAKAVLVPLFHPFSTLQFPLPAFAAAASVFCGFQGGFQGVPQGLEKPPTKRISGPYPSLNLGGGTNITRSAVYCIGKYSHDNRNFY